MTSEGSAGPTEQEVREQVEAELEKLRVSDLLLHTTSSLCALAYARLAPDVRDLGEAKLAIDAVRAVLPVLEGALPAEPVRDLRQALANLQLGYAQLAAAPTAPAQEDEAAAEAPAPEPEPAVEEGPAG